MLQMVIYVLKFIFLCLCSKYYLYLKEIKIRLYDPHFVDSNIRSILEQVMIVIMIISCHFSCIIAYLCLLIIIIICYYIIIISSYFSLLLLYLSNYKLGKVRSGQIRFNNMISINLYIRNIHLYMARNDYLIIILYLV